MGRVVRQRSGGLWRAILPGLLTLGMPTEQVLLTHLLPHPWRWTWWVGHSLPSLVVGAGTDEEPLLLIGCWCLGWPGAGRDWRVRAAVVSLAWECAYVYVCVHAQAGGVRGPCISHTHHAPGGCRSLGLPGSDPVLPWRSVAEWLGLSWCPPGSGAASSQPSRAQEARCVPLSSALWQFPCPSHLLTLNYPRAGTKINMGTQKHFFFE